MSELDNAPELKGFPIKRGSYTLSRDEIFELGFLRSNPQRTLYKHKSISGLYLHEKYYYDVSVRDQIAYKVVIYKLKIVDEVVVEENVYETNKPTKQEIEEIISKYGDN